MKKIIFLSSLLFAGFWACKPDKKDHFTVSGDLEGANAPYIYLVTLDDGPVTRDSAVLKGGHFEFKGTVAEPQKVLLRTKLHTKNVYMLFFLENADIRVKGNIDSPEHVKFSGSVSQSEYDSLEASYADISSREEAGYTQLEAEKKANDSIAVTALEMHLDTLRLQRRAKIAKFITDHPKSAVSADQVDYMSMAGDYALTKRLFYSLDTALQNSKIGKKIAVLLPALKKSAVGQPFMDFKLNDMNDKPVVFSQYNKGKYVLLDFWASWCGPCRAENPNVLKAYNLYKPKGLEILGVSLDNDANSWKKAVREDRMPWTQVSDLKGWKNEAVLQYGIQAIPFNFLIDPSGRIVAKNMWGMALERKLAEVFK